MPNSPDDRDAPQPEGRAPASGSTGAAGDAPPPDAQDTAASDGEQPLERTLRERLQELIPEIVRKTFHAGVGAVLSTEEGIRKMAPDFTLPKEAVNYVLNTADGAKDEVVRVIGRELRDFLGKLNVSQELAKLLTQLSFEIKTEVRFIPNDQAVGGVRPDIKNKVALKRQKGDTKPLRPTPPNDRDGTDGTEGEDT